MKNKGEGSFSIFLPPPSPLRYLIAAEFPRKMSEGTRYGFESSAKKFLSPGGLTGPASDAGASVATGMSRNARRTVTPTSIARCCTAWHGARDNHRPGREGRKGRERQRERARVGQPLTSDSAQKPGPPLLPLPRRASTLSPPHFKDRRGFARWKTFLSSSSKKGILPGVAGSRPLLRPE